METKGADIVVTSGIAACFKIEEVIELLIKADPAVPAGLDEWGILSYATRDSDMATPYHPDDVSYFDISPIHETDLAGRNVDTGATAMRTPYAYSPVSKPVCVLWAGPVKAFSAGYSSLDEAIDIITEMVPWLDRTNDMHRYLVEERLVRLTIVEDFGGTR